MWFVIIAYCIRWWKLLPNVNSVVNGGKFHCSKLIQCWSMNVCDIMHVICSQNCCCLMLWPIQSLVDRNCHSNFIQIHCWCAWHSYSQQRKYIPNCKWSVAKIQIHTETYNCYWLRVHISQSINPTRKQTHRRFMNLIEVIVFWRATLCFCRIHVL